MKTKIKARIPCSFISKTTIMVNKRETMYFIISISDKRLSSFFVSLNLSFLFYLYLLFPYLFRLNFVVSEQNVHISFDDISGGTFSPLLDISERNFFSSLGGGGCTCTQCTSSPAYAPGVFSLSLETSRKNVLVLESACIPEKIQQEILSFKQRQIERGT